MGCSASQRQSDVVESISASSSVTSFQKVRQSDAALVMADVGAASAKKKELKQMINKGRQEIKDAQEKLNSSLTTPLADAEIRVLEKGTWLSEVKDMTRRFNTLPPIAQGNKVKNNAMAFTID